MKSRSWHCKYDLNSDMIGGDVLRRWEYVVFIH